VCLFFKKKRFLAEKKCPSGFLEGVGTTKKNKYKDKEEEV
jgi:hypothetical protein